MAKVFIDGEHGTTGLQIRERLAARDDIALLSLPAEDRRDAGKRAALLQEADIAILCLPDEAAREAVSLAKDHDTRFIDASTAHRTAGDWIYGFAEMAPGQAERIGAAQFVANPGCYPTGAIGLIRPLTDAGILPRDYPITVNAVSGYSGGGKQMIAQMEDQSATDAISANHFAYGLTLSHKHVPEIAKHGGLSRRPIFTPAVGRFAQGMLVNVPLYLDLLGDNVTLHTIHEALSDHYAGQQIVTVAPLNEAATLPRLDAELLTGTDRMELFVFGSEENRQANLVATLDNLGKGASGAAVQNLDLMLAS